MSFADTPHRRRNLLTGEWILVSPHRANRPWQGETSSVPTGDLPGHEPSCHLCPGNRRAGGLDNPKYEAIHVFQNDFPALLTDPENGIGETALFQEQSVSGECRVICYSPDHSLTLARMDDPGRRMLIDCWCDQSRELGARWQYVQLFENKGAMMGASSPHPHGQVWASDFIPELVIQEDVRQREYQSEHGNVLLDGVVKAEIEEGVRVVEANADWLAIVPHWAAWPFETLLVARGPRQRLEDLATSHRDNLAQILGRLLTRYDGLFGTDFPYSMGWHGAPHGLADDGSHWRLHAHFYPPLLRSASVRKHMVGFELLAETQRDLTPESAAERLRTVTI